MGYLYARSGDVVPHFVAPAGILQTFIIPNPTKYAVL